MVTDSTHMALFIVAMLLLWALILIFVGPRITPYSRKQWALIMATLFVFWTPMGCYIFFVVVPSRDVDQRHVARVALLNLVICVPVVIAIGRKILRK
jgi:hypothetical protein